MYTIKKQNLFYLILNEKGIKIAEVYLHANAVKIVEALNELNIVCEVDEY